VALGGPDRPVSFTVPTGNFGDIFAGYAAKRMGLPIERLVIATNDNDILARTLASGRYETRGVIETTSPSMDIQISSNFERLLFEAAGRDAALVRREMESLKQSGAFQLETRQISSIRQEFAAGRSTMAETAAILRSIQKEDGYLVDPHTATALKVARETADPKVPMVVLSTAHPAKFPAAVKEASGIEPALPAFLADLMGRKENFTTLPSDPKMLEDYVMRRTRAARVQGVSH
jgi:threonine synthase